jgi:hypothetical protein
MTVGGDRRVTEETSGLGKRGAAQRRGVAAIPTAQQLPQPWCWAMLFMGAQ